MSDVNASKSLSAKIRERHLVGSSPKCVGRAECKWRFLTIVHFCIEFSISVNDRIDVREVCRAIEYLGGIPAGNEFTFSNAQRRDEALTLLCDKYGTRYFAAVETETKEGQVEAMLTFREIIR